MTLVSEIINKAFRENGLLSETNYPNPSEGEDALYKLNSIFKSILGYEAGEQLLDIPLSLPTTYQNYTFMDYPPICDVKHPPVNSRLIAGNGQPQEVFFSPQPRDGARMGILDPLSVLSTSPVTLNGNGRLIEGQPSLVLNLDGSDKTWFYRADKADWVLLTPISDPSAEMPFPEEFDDYFIIALSSRLNPHFGSATHPESSGRFLDLEGKLKSRYRQSQQVPSELSLWISPWYEFGYFPTGRI